MFKALVILLGISLIGQGCTSRPKTKEEFFEAGKQQLQAKEAGTAIIHFKNALEKDQKFAEARYQLGRAYISAGKYGAAEKELQKVLLQRPNSPEVRLELARAWSFGGKPDDALKAIARIGKISDKRDVLEISGWAYAQKGDHEKAVANLKEALAIRFDPAVALMLSRVYLLMRKPAEAREQLSELLKTDAADREAQFLLAEAAVLLNDPGTAFAIYDKMISSNPKDGAALVRKGRLFLKLRRYQEAVALSDQIIKTSPSDPDAYEIKGMGLLYLKNYKDAVQAFQKTVAHIPGVRTCYLLALAHFYNNELEQAMSQINRVLGFDPKFSRAHVIASLIYLKKDRIDDSIAEIRKIPADQERNGLAHAVLGTAYFRKGLHNEGFAELDRALELDPSLTDVRIKKGLFQLSLGNAGAAEDELDEAVRIDPDLLNGRVLLASYYLRKNENERAIRTAQQGLRNQKTDAVLSNLMADALLKQRQVEKARQALEKALRADPDYAETHFKIAALFQLSGEPEKAVDMLKKFALGAPHNVQAQLIVAALLERDGNGAAAEEFYERCLKTGKLEGDIESAKYYLRNGKAGRAAKILEESGRKHPGAAPVHAFKGQAYLEQKRFEEALRAFEDLAKIEPDAGLRAVINTYLAMQKPEKALDRVRHEMRKAPGRADVQAELSRIYIHMNKHSEAADNARLLIQREPESAAGYMSLAAVHVSEKQQDKAIEVLKGARAVRDVNLAMMLGNLYAGTGNYSAALTEYRKAEGLQAGFVKAVFQQASMLELMDKRKEAISEYQRVVKLQRDHVGALNNLAYLHAEDRASLSSAMQYAVRAYVLSPGNPAVQDTLGYVLLRSGKIEEGLKALKRAEKGMPDNPSVQYHLALALREKHDRVAAIGHLRKAVQAGDFPEFRQAKEMLEELGAGAGGK